MTEEQILELVKEHFEEDWDDVDGWEYSGNFDAFVKFALAIHESAFNEGYDQGFDEGHRSGTFEEQ